MLLSTLVALASASIAAAATEAPEWPIPIPPSLLPEHKGQQILNANPIKPENVRLIQTIEGHYQWTGDIELLLRDGVRLMDVTDHWRVADNEAVPTSPLPTKLQHQKSLHNITEQVSVSHIKENLLKLTSFHTRYYRTSTGAAASDWIQSVIKGYAKDAAKGWKISVTPFPHSWPQNSIIVHLEDANATEQVNSKENGVVILGAHLDSVNWLNPWWGRSPGADDDGSGTVTLLEIVRLVFHNYIPLSHPIEFHFYSGEEAGLKGSQAISEYYQKEKRPVVGMLQLDMTGYWDQTLGRKMGIVGDYTDPELTDMLRLVVDEYTSNSTGRLETTCAYACSDHSSWKRAGYRSAFAMETEFHSSNPNIHTSGDDVDKVDITWMAEFVKVGVGLAGELAVM